MTAAALFETLAPVWTPDGCLAAVPQAANDNHSHSIMPTVGMVRDGPAGAEIWYGPHTGAVPTPVTLPYTGQPVEVVPAALRPTLSFDHLPPVIALSGAAGSGKSTVSDFLASRFGYTKTKFAAPLKAMCRAIGMSDDMIEGDAKETAVSWLCGRTPRYAMQTLGTAWGRDCMGSDFWVNMWRQDAMRYGLVVVDDCRFPNEAAAVRRMGGHVIRLIGRGGITGGHVSESADFLADEVICNDGSIADLQERVLEVLEGWR